MVFCFLTGLSFKSIFSDLSFTYWWVWTVYFALVFLSIVGFVLLGSLISWQMGCEYLLGLPWRLIFSMELGLSWLWKSTLQNMSLAFWWGYTIIFWKHKNVLSYWIYYLVERNMSKSFFNILVEAEKFHHCLPTL